MHSTDRLRPSRCPITSPRARSGRVVITFETSDIDWGWSWWQRLLLMQPNDLTGLTLVLVPVSEGGRVTWEDCEEGTVPKRNRHYRCSAHR